MRIFAISGSLRPDSSNSALLRAAALLAPSSTQLDVFDREIGDLPHFRPDLDEEGTKPPQPVADLRSRLRASDAVMISCPEYAHGVPGSFKNALDWLVSTSELTGKPTALLMAGPGGAKQAWAALVPTLRVMGCDLVFEASLVVARRHFAEDGRISDAGIEAALRDALRALSEAVSG